MKFKFENIPELSKFVVFDFDQNRFAETYEIPLGDKEIDFEIPSDWKRPHYTIKTVLYYIPDSYVPITDTRNPITISGADYYIDVTQDDAEVKQNWKSVEGLIFAINHSDLEPRQKFFTSLLSLNSYFEYLVHAMLVLSGYISNNRFRDLGNHENRIAEGFSKDNTAFFAPAFDLCPGKSVEIAELPQNTRSNLMTVMNDVRKLRNDVAHKWGYRDVPEERIKSLFETAKIVLPPASNSDAFFEYAAQYFARIWTMVRNPLNMPYTLILEREAIRTERAERG